MTPLATLLLLSVCGALAQYAEDRAPRYIATEPKVTSTPVPILKQINRHNEDGSYTYGYEAADGSFKIETKSEAGEVKGKYGYKDDTGKLRVIEYGANKYGFQPAGEGITVAPPTLVDESTRDEGLRPSKHQQGGRSQYRAPAQAQSIDYDYEEPAPAPRPAPRPAPQQQYRPAPPPQPQQQYRPAPPPQPQYRPAPPQPQQQYRPAPQSAPTPPKPQFFAGAAPTPVEQDNFFNPEPQQRQYKPKQEFRPAPQPQQFSSRPQEFNSQFDQAPARFPTQNQIPQQRQSFSMLDQLLKEYSLPQGGSAPLHDISFGSY
ncbi:PREDICTED: skin secretory protein xP2-like isoform X1 [Papilio xuthus]|uniref:Skin secretory protein xP2-like isoform X1 n=1 Tax=Papilio xuthus TaxID=66420 RepID=A0AAJ6ZNY8_PAPXU|nr:PREDICTED: skin secretory protein xP2-like isoform X1 [Papilio xuthus]